MAVRARALGVAGTDGGEPVPDPPPPFVADDLARLAPLILETVRNRLARVVDSGSASSVAYVRRLTSAPRRTQRKEERCRSLRTGSECSRPAFSSPELRRSQARRLASDLVAQGQLARDQLGAAVDELVEISRRRSEELRKVVSTEVQRQLGGLGLATKNDLAALERRLTGASKTTTSATKKSPKTAPAKKAPAKKAPAKKPAKKAAARKTPARKSVAKAAARRAPAKRAR